MGFAIVHQFDGADAAPLKFFCCAGWSHT